MTTIERFPEIAAAKDNQCRNQRFYFLSAWGRFQRVVAKLSDDDHSMEAEGNRNGLKLHEELGATHGIPTDADLAELIRKAWNRSR